MKTDQQWVELENLTAEWVDAIFRDHIGLDVDPAEIEHHAQAVLSLAEEMAPSYRDHPDAWSLLYDHLEYAQLTPITLEIKRLSEEHYTFDDILLDDQPVTPYTRAKYLRLENNPEKRHRIITRVAKGYPEVDQAIERHQ